MDNISVTYMDHMGSDLSVVNAARLSFDKHKTELNNQDKRLINYLATHEHTSPFRHTSLSVVCEAPIFLARQLGKHQVGLSWNEVSRRYVDSDPAFFIPDEWRSRPDRSIKQGSGGVSEWSDHYSQQYVQLLEQAHRLYSNMIKDGVAPEMARMALPQSMITKWAWTGSVQAFAHIYLLRIDYHAQKEAQFFAELLRNVVVQYFPYSWKALLEANTNG